MTTEYTITLSDEQKFAFETVTWDIKDWIENSAHERARIAADNIIKNLISYCNSNEIALAVGRSAQIQQAIDLGLAVKVKDPSTFGPTAEQESEESEESTESENSD
jgi:hypothetical protein